MKKIALAFAAGAAVAVAAPASAAEIVLVQDGDSLTGDFSANITTAGNFSEIFTFELPEAGFTAASIITIAVGAASNIDFTSVTLNGQAFTLTRSPGSPRDVDSGFIRLATTAGTQTLVVNGVSGTNAAFSGTVSFTAGAIPEPGTWALMILGFGAIGFAMRSRRKDVSVKTNYNFA